MDDDINRDESFVDGEICKRKRKEAGGILTVSFVLEAAVCHHIWIKAV